MTSPHDLYAPNRLARPIAGRRSRFLALAVAFSVGAAACGGASEPGLSAPTPPDSEAPAAADGEAAPTPDNLFPNVQVQNITDGSTLNLQEELQGGDLPVLLWFFAPH